MSYLVLARKYRPKSFSELIGQEHVVRTLQNAIGKGRLSHAYIFSGSRGVGKTTAARLLAKAVNCEEGPQPEPCNRCDICREIDEGRSLDVIEIDGASNRGIDQVRQLRENVKFAPSRARYKVYIIDEVHMLTTEAFNALLKTLEEPPAHVKFIFATTEPDKLPATIQSRCQRFDFRLLTREEIVGQLELIIGKEGYSLSRKALLDIARAAEGSLRDSQGLLEQVISFAGEEAGDELVEDVLHLVRGEVLERFIKGIEKRDYPDLIRVVDELASRGFDMRNFLKEILEWLRGILLVSLSPDLMELVPLVEEDRRLIGEYASRFSRGRLLALIQVAIGAERELKSSSSSRYVMEMTALKMAQTMDYDDLESLVRRFEEISRKIEGETRESPRPEEGEGVYQSSRTEAPLLAATDVEPGEGDGEEEIPGGKEEPLPGEVSPVEDEKYLELTGDEVEVPEEMSDWERFLLVVEKKKVSLGSFLEHGRMISLEGGELAIGFPKAASIFMESAQENDNPALLREAAVKVFGEKTRVRLQLIEEEDGGQVTGESRRQTDLMKKREREALNNPLVQDILDTFGGRVLDVNVE
jgi:DNA polymerase-3 subunit gamma/tau